jgi:O-antigen/teichoic acid export membrane protein
VSGVPEDGKVAPGAPDGGSTEVELASDDEGRPVVVRRTFLFEVSRLLTTNAMHAVLLVSVGIATVRIWGIDARGWVQVAMAVPGIAALVFDLGLGTALPYMIGRRVAPLRRIAGAALSMWMITSTLGILLSVGYFLSPGGPDLAPIWVVVAVAVIPLQLFSSLANGFAVGVEEVGFLSKVPWVRDPMMLTLVLVFGLGLGLRDPSLAWLRILAQVIAFGVGLVMGLRLLWRHTRGPTLTWDGRLVGETLHRSAVFGLGPLFLQLNQQGPAMLITLAAFSVPKAHIGNYTIGAAIAMLLFQVAFAAGHVLMSRSVNATDNRAQALKAARLARVGIAVLIPTAAGMAVVAPWLVPLVYGRDVNIAATVMQLLLPGIVSYFVLHTFSVDLTAKGRAWLVAMVTAPMLGASVAVNALWAIPSHGVRGVAAAVSAVYILGACVMIVVYARATGLTLMEVVRPHRDDLEVWHKFRAGALRRGGRIMGRRGRSS